MPQRFWGPGPPGLWDPENRGPGDPKAPGLRGPRVQARCATRSRRRSDPGPPIDPRGLGEPCGQENKHPRVLCFQAGNRGSLTIGDPIVGEASPNRRFNKHGQLRGRSGGPNRRFNKHDHFRGRSGGPNRRFDKHGQFRGRSGGPKNNDLSWFWLQGSRHGLIKYLAFFASSDFCLVSQRVRKQHVGMASLYVMA